MSRPGTTTEQRLSLLLLLVAASQRMGQLVDAELAAEGVDSAHYALLSLIGIRGPLRLTEAAIELGMPLTTASDAVRRLEANGRVDRLPNPEDGRSSLFQLSEAGQVEWKRGWPAVRRIHEDLAARLENVEEVRAALEALVEAFDLALENTN